MQSNKGGGDEYDYHQTCTNWGNINHDMNHLRSMHNLFQWRKASIHHKEIDGGLPNSSWLTYHAFYYGHSGNYGNVTPFLDTAR